MAGCAEAGSDVGPSQDTDAGSRVDALRFPDALVMEVDADLIVAEPDAGPVLACEGDVHLFYFTGASQSFVSPDGIALVRIKAWGAGGAAGRETAAMPGQGGGGAFVTVAADVDPAEELIVMPGEGGYMPGGGGGASYVRRQDGRVLAIAAGGGGGGTDGGSPSSGAPHGGAGGAEFGEDGIAQQLAPWGSAMSGAGGGPMSGGGGGDGIALMAPVACDGGDGDQDQAGQVSSSASCLPQATAQFDHGGLGGSNGGGGSGGAGYFGGGGGGSVYTYVGGGGGGGSSYFDNGVGIGGVGQEPGSITDADYDDSSGRGGTPGDWPDIVSEPGARGLIVICEVPIIP